MKWPLLYCSVLGSMFCLVALGATIALAAEPVEVEPAVEEPVDPPAEPDGTPEALLERITQLARTGPKRPITKPNLLEFYAAILEASEKILAAEPDDAQTAMAVNYKLQAIGGMSQAGDTEALGKLRSFVDELKEQGKPQVARQGQQTLLTLELRAAADEPETLEQKVKEIQAFLSEIPMQRADLGWALNVASTVFRVGDPETAAEAYEAFAELARKSEDAVVAGYADRLLSSARRMRLPGKPMEIEGVTMDGQAFDWDEFRKDKVVLIDFWATWCGPCRAEIPHLKEIYAAYHDRGFEIVGIAGDDTREPLEEFLAEEEIPWTILYGKEGPSPTMTHYGISAFPTMLMVGRDGNVVSLSARGPELMRLLGELIGPENENETEGDAETSGEADSSN